MPASPGEPRLVLTVPHYTEGCVVADDGTLYFSQTAASTISVVPGLALRSRVERGHVAAHVWAHVPAANGHAIAADGTHVVAASVGALLRLDAHGATSEVLATAAGGEWLVYPNDVAIDRHHGGCWFTDSGYKATPKRAEGDGKGRVCRVSADGAVTVAAGGLQYANGIALTPDGARLLVGESVTSRLWAYAVQANGELAERTLFAELPRESGKVQVPDGITIDVRGRVFVAHYGAGEVVVYAPDGALTARLAAGNRAVSHVALTADGRRAFVSGAPESESGEGAIFELDLDVLPR